MIPDALNFIAGEERFIQFEVTSTKGETVVITEAVYEITHGSEVVDTGKCEILNGSVIQLLACMNEWGVYDLELTYKIAPETRKVRCHINVR